MGRGHPPPSPTLPFCWAGVGGGAGPRLQPRRSGRAGPSKGGTGPKQANWRALKLTGPGAGGGGGGGRRQLFARAEAAAGAAGMARAAPSAD